MMYARLPWVARASALLYGGVVLVAAVFGHTQFVDVAHAAWPAAAILLAGAVIAGGAAAWAVAGLALAGSCWVLLNLVELVLTGTVTSRDGHSDWTAFAERLGLAAIGALFAATAMTRQRRAAGMCVHCGQPHPPRTQGRWHPEPHRASLAVRRAAYVGCGLFLPYFVLHALGVFGVPGIEPHGFRPSLAALVALLVGIGLAVFLLLGLVRPWGMVFPRWTLWLAGHRVPRFLPLTLVWLIAPTLALYGTGSLVYGFFTSYGVLSLGGATSVAFGGYGWALCVAAVSYQTRTRPTCRVRTLPIQQRLAAGVADPSTRRLLSTMEEIRQEDSRSKFTTHVDGC